MDPVYQTHLKRGFEGLGRIEGNVDKFIMKQLKGRGKNWDNAGVKAMLATCRHQSVLIEEAFKPFRHQTKQKPS